MKYLISIAIGIALFAFGSSASVQAGGCDTGNTPNVIQIQHGIYQCDGEVSDLFPFGHVYGPHLAGATACIEALRDLDLEATAAFFGRNAAPGVGLVSTFCSDLLYIGDGPNACSYWHGAGGNDQGIWPEANLEACAQWRAVAFSEHSAEAGATYQGGGVVCTAINGCRDTLGAAADNPATDVVILNGEVFDDGEFVAPGTHPDTDFQTEIAVLVPEDPDLAPFTIQIKPPSAGDGGLLDVLPILNWYIVGTLVAIFFVMGLGTTGVTLAMLRKFF